MKKKIILLLCFAFVTVAAWAFSYPVPPNYCIDEEEGHPATGYCNKVNQYGSWVYKCEQDNAAQGQTKTCWGNLIYPT
tara:strand:- start:1857 stop:2090 length:234 start_codon:yes stop_codon:yes gene_type:complete